MTHVPRRLTKGFALRFAIICFVCLLSWGRAWSQSPTVVDAARRSAYPLLQDAAALSWMLLRDIETTALGCDLIAGTPLASPIEVYRLEFPLADEPFAVQVSADGSLAQPCDERFPNLGAGVIQGRRARLDADGDGLVEGADACPQIAGPFASAPAGCPQPTDADRDGDGTPNERDRCPDQAGAAAADGCALLRDQDGDGIADHLDICGANFGIMRDDFARGCPADGSGSSTRRRAADDACHAIGNAPIYEGRANDAAIIGDLNARLDEASRRILGRTAATDWYQLASGWVKSAGLHLTGACYNIPLVNPAPGGFTGCFMRPQADFADVRLAPGGKRVSRIFNHQIVAALGRSYDGSWLFFRLGWVRRSLVELSGSCDQLPALDPAKAAAGVIHFCAPGYPGLLRPRIHVGEQNTRVVSDDLANRLRAAPDASAEQIGEIPPRAILDAVLDGPACKPPYIWWQVKIGDLIGWTVESDVNFNYYYLEPLAGAEVAGDGQRDLTARSPAEDEGAWSRRIIHSANAAALDTVKLLAIDAPLSLAWSPRGAELAVVTKSGSLKRYSYPELAPGAPPLAAPGARPITAIAFSPDATTLAIGGADGAVTLVDLQSGQSVAGSQPVGELAHPVVALGWSRAGDKLAAISGDGSRRIARRAGSLKLWDINPTQPAEIRLRLHYVFPYPLTSLAFSDDGQLLAATGESTADERAGLWIYRLVDGGLLYSKALAPMRGLARVVSSPDAALGDFVYSSGDSLYQIHVASAENVRIYHQAGMLLPHFTFRRQVMPDAEALLALSARARNGATRLRVANALNAYAPGHSLSVAPSAVAFSPDGRALAVAERAKDRVLVLGVIET